MPDRKSQPMSRLLNRGDSVLVVIDVQEGYRDKTVDHARMVGGVRRLIEAARIVGVPVLVTEQYPRGLGHTQKEVAEVLAGDQVLFEKLSMSCWRQAEFAAALRALRRRQVVLCGIETHACVNQTAHDLIEAGYQVHLAADATSARSASDRDIAIDKALGSGCVPATVEMVCLEWVRTAEAPEFKALHRLIK